MSSYIQVPIRTVCKKGHVETITGSFQPEFGSAIFGSDAAWCAGCERVCGDDYEPAAIVGFAPALENDTDVDWGAKICETTEGDKKCNLYFRAGYHRHTTFTDDGPIIWGPEQLIVAKREYQETLEAMSMAEYMEVQP